MTLGLPSVASSRVRSRQGIPAFGVNSQDLKRNVNADSRLSQVKLVLGMLSFTTQSHSRLPLPAPGKATSP